MRYRKSSTSIAAPIYCSAQCKISEGYRQQTALKTYVLKSSFFCLGFFLSWLILYSLKTNPSATGQFSIDINKRKVNVINGVITVGCTIQGVEIAFKCTSILTACNRTTTIKKGIELMFKVLLLPSFEKWLKSLKDPMTRLRLSRRLEKAQEGHLGVREGSRSRRL